MSDRMLEDKFRGLSAGMCPGNTDRLIDLCRGADKLADAGEIARNAGTPHGRPQSGTLPETGS